MVKPEIYQNTTSPHNDLKKVYADKQLSSSAYHYSMSVIVPPVYTILIKIR